MNQNSDRGLYLLELYFFKQKVRKTLSFDDDISDINDDSQSHYDNDVCRRLFEEGSEDESVETVSLISSAILKHKRGPLYPLRSILKSQDSLIKEKVLRNLNFVIHCLPDYCQDAFLAGHVLKVSDFCDVSSIDDSRTPHKRAALGSHGSDPHMRLGPKIYSDRELIRDQISNILTNGKLVFEISIEKIFCHLNEANFEWIAKTILECYMRR